MIYDISCTASLCLEPSHDHLGYVESCTRLSKCCKRCWQHDIRYGNLESLGRTCRAGPESCTKALGFKLRLGGGPIGVTGVRSKGPSRDGEAMGSTLKGEQLNFDTWSSWSRRILKCQAPKQPFLWAETNHQSNICQWKTLKSVATSMWVAEFPRMLVFWSLQEIISSHISPKLLESFPPVSLVPAPRPQPPAAAPGSAAAWPAPASARQRPGRGEWSRCPAVECLNLRAIWVTSGWNNLDFFSGSPEKWENRIPWDYMGSYRYMMVYDVYALCLPTSSNQLVTNLRRCQTWTYPETHGSIFRSILSVQLHIVQARWWARSCKLRQTEFPSVISTCYGIYDFQRIWTASTAGQYIPTGPKCWGSNQKSAQYIWDTISWRARQQSETKLQSTEKRSFFRSSSGPPGGGYTKGTSLKNIPMSPDQENSGEGRPKIPSQVLSEVCMATVKVWFIYPRLVWESEYALWYFSYCPICIYQTCRTHGIAWLPLYTAYNIFSFTPWGTHAFSFSKTFTFSHFSPPLCIAQGSVTLEDLHAVCPKLTTSCLGLAHKVLGVSNGLGLRRQVYHHMGMLSLYVCVKLNAEILNIFKH